MFGVSAEYFYDAGRFGSGAIRSPVPHSAIVFAVLPLLFSFSLKRHLTNGESCVIISRMIKKG
jgi:hypothetical protein